MGKTKTAFVSGTEENKQKSSYDKAAKAAKRKAKESLDSARDKKVHLVGLKGGQRVKIVEAAAGEEAPVSSQTKADKEEKVGKIKVRGKKYLELRNKIDQHKLYDLAEAIKLLKETSYSKFNGTVELHLVVKKKGLAVNIALPYSSGKSKRVEIADEKTVAKLKAGKIDFDLLLATAEMMPKLVPFAKSLGPKGLMPNPKNGTIIKSAKEAEKFKGNNLNLKTEKEAPLIHTIAGKVDQKESELEANIKAIFSGVGEKQIVKVYLKSTMSPAIKLQT